MDDDGIVEVVDDYINENDGQTQSFLYFLYQTAIGTIESYGWFILIFVVLVLYLKSKLSQVSPRRTEKKEVNEEEALEQMRRIEMARMRQQEAFDLAKAKYLEEKRLKMEQEAKERAEDWERHKQGLGYKSKSKPNDEKDDLANLGLSANNAIKKKPRLKDSDYNPLMGSDSGPSCSFRSSRPGPRAGG